MNPIDSLLASHHRFFPELPRGTVGEGVEKMVMLERSTKFDLEHLVDLYYVEGDSWWHQPAILVPEGLATSLDPQSLGTRPDNHIGVLILGVCSMADHLIMQLYPGGHNRLLEDQVEAMGAVNVMIHMNRVKQAFLGLKVMAEDRSLPGTNALAAEFAEELKAMLPEGARQQWAWLD